MFKVVIIGGEQINNYEKFRKKCIYYLQNKAKEGIMIYSKGDKFVDQFAKRYSIATKFFPCDFKTFGKDALKERAERMLRECDGVIAFRSDLKENNIIIKMADKKNLPIRVIK